MERNGSMRASGRNRRRLRDVLHPSRARGHRGAVIQIATERASMGERAQEILDMLGGVVVLQGRVDGA